MHREAFGCDFESVSALRAHSSERRIFRLVSNAGTSVAVYNENTAENRAYTGFTEFFLSCKLSVPKILAVSGDGLAYLAEDLGDMTLHSFADDRGTEQAYGLYKSAVTHLSRFQLSGRSGFDFSLCHPSSVFGTKIIAGDIAKFREYYLERMGNRLNTFSEGELTNLFLEIAERNTTGCFMYRDFQPRNIMIRNDKLFYIDFQSGMNGPVQYDLVSFLYSGSINIDKHQRHELSDIYFDGFSKASGTDIEALRDDMPEIALLRMVQVIGSYSFVHSRNPGAGTLGKIPKAVANVESLLPDLKEGTLKCFAVELCEKFTKDHS